MIKGMKIAIINTGNDAALGAEARAFLPKLLSGLIANGTEIYLFTNDAADDNLNKVAAEANSRLHQSLWRMNGATEHAAHDSARWLGEFETDVYTIWNGDALAWSVLPLLDPQTATVAIGHADSEVYYAPARHYRPFLTRTIGTTPEVCVGLVINCVIDKERVEWLSYGEIEGSDAVLPEEELQTVVEAYETCFEKAIADARAAPRETSADFPPMKAAKPARESWLAKLKAKIMN
jgi:hypothetical protein